VLAGLHLVGLFTFAILIGIISDSISDGVASLRLGNFRVPESGHTVILGWEPSRTGHLVQQVGTVVDLG
jgi:hypothetical protein